MVEMFFLISGLCLYKFYSRQLRLIALTLIGMGVGVWFKCQEMQYAIFNVEVGRGVQCFFLGGLIWLWIESVLSRRERRKMLWWTTGVFFISTVLVVVKKVNIYEDFAYLPMIVFPYILIISIFCQPVKRVLTMKIFEQLNGITYEMFLLQYPVFIAFKMIGDGLELDYYSTIVWILFWIVLLGVCYTFSVWKKRIGML